MRKLGLTLGALVLLGSSFGVAYSLTVIFNIEQLDTSRSALEPAVITLIVSLVSFVIGCVIQYRLEYGES